MAVKCVVVADLRANCLAITCILNHLKHYHYTTCEEGLKLTVACVQLGAQRLVLKLIKVLVVNEGLDSRKNEPFGSGFTKAFKGLY